MRIFFQGAKRGPPMDQVMLKCPGLFSSDEDDAEPALVNRMQASAATGMGQLLTYLKGGGSFPQVSLIIRLTRLAVTRPGADVIRNRMNMSTSGEVKQSDAVATCSQCLQISHTSAVVVCLPLAWPMSTRFFSSRPRSSLEHEQPGEADDSLPAMRLPGCVAESAAAAGAHAD